MEYQKFINYYGRPWCAEATKVQCTKVMFNATNTVSTQLFGKGLRRSKLGHHQVVVEVGFTLWMVT